MAEDYALPADSDSSLTKTWWAGHRLRYNIGLVVAGLPAFICYVAAVERCIDLRVPGDWEVTIFTTLFQGFAYLIMIGAANACYQFGPWSERLIKPTNPARYRKIAFRMGFLFSVLLPFTPDVLLFFSCSVQMK